jgi:hypothetical protein
MFIIDKTVPEGIGSFSSLRAAPKTSIRKWWDKSEILEDSKG